MKLFRLNSKSSDTGPIDVPLDSDILLGRTKNSWNHIGNKKFRAFVGLHLKRYMEAATRLEKTLVVNDITERVQEAGGRFLKLGKDGRWAVVTQKTAREKVGHALRDAVGLRVKLSEATSPSPATTTTTKLSIGQRRASNITMERRRSSVIASQVTMSIPRTLLNMERPRPAVIESEMLRNARKAALDLGEEKIVVNTKPSAIHTKPDIPLTKLTMGAGSITLEHLKKSSVRIEKLKGDGSQKSMRSSDLFDSGEISLMSMESNINPDIFDITEGASSDFSMVNAKPIEKGSGSLPIRRESFDDGGPAMTRMVKQLSDRVELQMMEDFKSAKKAVRTEPLASSGKSSGSRRSNSLTDIDISEEFSIMSISEVKAQLMGEGRPSITQGSSGRGFPMNSIKPRAGWESEVSEEFSLQGLAVQTSGKTSSTASDVSEDSKGLHKDSSAVKQVDESRSSTMDQSTEAVGSRTVQRSNQSSIVLEFERAERKTSSITFITRDSELSQQKFSTDDLELEEAIKRSPPSTSTSADMDGRLESGLSSLVITREYIVPNPTPIREKSGLGSSGRKKMLKLLSDVGEDEALEHDSMTGLQESNGKTNQGMNEEKMQNFEQEISETFSVDTDQEWKLTLKALSTQGNSRE